MSEPELLEWESRFWGVRIARAERSAGANEWAKKNAVDMVWLLVDAEDPAEAQRAEGQGFRFMDVRVTLGRPTGSWGPGCRRGRIEDLPALRRIARVSHQITRFYADPSLYDARCNDLYADWIAHSFSDWADIVLVSDYSGEADGYVTVHLNGDTSSIGLIAVEEASRGRGVGRRLVESALAWARGQEAKTMTVVTQGRNIAAQRLFQSCGFTTSATALWFHQRYGRTP